MLHLLHPLHLLHALLLHPLHLEQGMRDHALLMWDMELQSMLLRRQTIAHGPV